MSKAPLLTIAYLEQLPESSGRVIAGMAPQDAAAFFATIPTRIVAPVVERMEKWPVALCLQYLPIEQAAAILRAVSYQDALVLLRLMPIERRGDVLEQLPSRLAGDLSASLRYPRNCVGAWMDMSVPSLSLAASVKDALAVVRTSQELIGESIFVVDDGHRLAGLVRAETLLRHSPSARLVDIMQTGLKPLFARMLLREAASVSTWDDFLRVPVAGRHGQLLGILSRRDMNRALATMGATPGGPASHGPIWSHMGQAFIVSLLGLVRVLEQGNASSQ